MTSILKVDTIQDTAGNNIINESSDTITIGASGDTVTTSANVGIGTTNPVRQLHVNATSGNNAYLHLTNATSGTTTTDGFSILVTDSSAQVILNQRENEPMSFYTNNTERMRIDSLGGLAVGKTGSALGTAGSYIDIAGNEMCVLNNIPLYINRLGNDGNLINFYQATTLEGNISVSGATVCI
jgi:hypothetical protein